MPRDKLVYICSPYRGDVEENVRKAQLYSVKAMIDHPDVLPIAPHLLFTQYLDDNDPEQRRMGLSAGLDLLSICDELWVYGLDNPSEGMAGEIALAQELSIPIRDGFNPDEYDPDEDVALYGRVKVTIPGSSIYADDSDILYAEGPKTVTIGAEAIFEACRRLRQYPGKDIDLVISENGTAAQP